MEIQNLNNLSRSEEAFTRALFQLMEEKPFESITICELSKAADYDRKTFYRHFTSKEDVLKLYCSYILNEMAAMEKDLGTLTFYTGILSYFRFWEQHMDFLYLLEKHGLLHFMEDNQAELIYEYVGKQVQPEIPDNIEKATDFSKYSVFFTYGGLWSILVYWLKQRPHETPEKLTEYVLEYLRQSAAYIGVE